MNLDNLSTLTLRESQDWVRIRIGAVMEMIAETGDYADGSDRTILGEDDRGQIMAAKPGTDDWWEPFDLSKPEHRAAADETVKRGALAFLDLEYGGSES